MRSYPVSKILLVVLALQQLLPVVQCYLPTTCPSRTNFQTTKWRLCSLKNDDYSETETQEMRDLVLSLSLEATDHDRRTRVRDVFHEALARPNGMPQRFTDLFDKILIEVGDKVQNEAKKKFFEAQAASTPMEDVESSTPTEDEQDLGSTTRSKTPEELQLWALVDMMVQTKTIVKKVNGELGSKGTFQ